MIKKQARKKFFIKDNFQMRFIVIFTLLLLIEVSAAGLLLLKASYMAVEKAKFSSHISIDKSACVLAPIIIKINLTIILSSILITIILLTFIYLKRHRLFDKIINAIDILKDGKTTLRLDSSGGKNTRRLIKEFNQAADALDQEKNELTKTINSLIEAENLNYIGKLHLRLRLLLLK